MLKVYSVNAEHNEISGPTSVRCYQASTVAELKESVARVLGLTSTEMRLVLEKHYKEYRELNCDEKTLKSEDFFQGSKVIIVDFQANFFFF